MLMHSLQCYTDLLKQLFPSSMLVENVLNIFSMFIKSDFWLEKNEPRPNQ